MNISISGTSFSTQARDMVLSGNWEDALNFLLEGLEGMTHEFAVLILSGKAHIDNDMELVYEIAEDYINKIKELYTNFFKYNSQWYKAIGIYEARTLEDRELLLTQFNERFNNHYQLDNERAYTYASLYKKDNEIIKNFKEVINDEDNQYQGFEHFVYLSPMGCTPPIWIQQELKEKQKYFKINKDSFNYLELRGSNEASTSNYSSTVSNNIPETVSIHTSIKSKVKSEPIVEDKENIIKNEEKYKSKIIQQNKKYGYITLNFNNKEYKIPKLPFLYWVYTSFENYEMPENFIAWEPVCPDNYKMDNDNRFHSDWMIGAGFDSFLYYENTQFRDKIIDLVSSTLNIHKHNNVLVVFGQEDFIVSKITKSNPKKDELLILDNASMDSYDLIKQAKGVISKRGSSLSHLAINSIEDQFPFVIIKNELPDNDEIYINMKKGFYFLRSEIGNKAFNLLIAQKYCLVPEFQFIMNKENEINLLSDSYIVRSSFVEEDSNNKSLAGQFYSYPFLSYENITPILEEFNYKNCFVQCMLECEFSGVAFFKNGVLKTSYVKGYNEVITDGLDNITTFLYDGTKIKKEFNLQTVIATKNGIKDINFSPLKDNYKDKIKVIYDNCIKLKEHFGDSFDIEFGFKDNQFNLIQIRPLNIKSKLTL